MSGWMDEAQRHEFKIILHMFAGACVVVAIKRVSLHEPKEKAGSSSTSR